jgi:small subunit ribosomal protein S8
MSDPIADLFTRIRNAGAAKQRYTDVIYSKMHLRILEVMKLNGFVADFVARKDGVKGMIRVYLRYDKKRCSVIQGLKRVSKPSCRRYVGSSQIPRVLGGMGVAIMSTCKGVMDGYSAGRNGVGGEVIGYVW